MNFYLLFKSLHLDCCNLVDGWPLLYLPRIFVYHSETKNNRRPKQTRLKPWKENYIIIL